MTGSGYVTYKDVELEVDYYSTPYVPERRYLSNGDPGYPAEGGEFDIEDIRVKGVSIFELLSETTISEIEEAYINQNRD